MSMNTQQMEIDTTAKRKIELNLSDADCERIYGMAGEAGLPVPALIGTEEILTREQLIQKINSYSKEDEFMVTFDFGARNGITKNKGNKDGQ